MATGVKTRVKLPKEVRAGDVITIKTLITHQMESGQRSDAQGVPIPRSIIHRFLCTFDGETVVDLDIGPGISTNPFFEFQAFIPGSGVFTFAWFDDDGSIYTDSRAISVV
ncbi:thiosulfate oxidation carrier complex protein SoxZ [Rhodobacteraceae bacterium B1Z28]|uniref:Thiosulfate oxidation carrier complex protein SoxZ n=1 Tax=Ruegeria haliotis TaxID=2747601 RepID=A0ABX2PRG2_9RHOB|nr:thiosulfate oxidation carrier complex protein SoxZ [Ruegeria haliotis]NVO56726.1 thiosulfate oxidation carrier complex protein SoxZ [Ruegeria haliotis]